MRYRELFRAGCVLLTAVVFAYVIPFDVCATSRDAPAGADTISGGNPGEFKNACGTFIKGPEYRYGKKKAPVQVILYSSLTCGHCANFHINTLPLIKKKYIKTGKVSIVLRFYPMDGPSTRATLYVRSLMKKSTRRKAIDALYRNQDEWVFSKPEDIALNLAAVTRGNIVCARAAIADKAQEDKLLKRVQELDKQGVDATPTFVIGMKTYDWELSLSEFEEKIAPYLKDIEKTHTPIDAHEKGKSHATDG